jgi:tRNA-2-methylthio-N6-dimethylallyladenosine synthase
MPSMRSYHIITFGCQMNEHDSERMAGILEAQGFILAASPEEAEMVILNTCSIREKAEQKFYSELGRLAHLRRKGGNTVTIAVAGCIAQQEGKKLLSRTPSVDLVIGPSDIARLSEMVERVNDHDGPVVATGGDPDYHTKQMPAARSDGLKAWLSIMYGCDNFCTYCVVPHLRGRERSRPPQDIVNEVRELAAKGYREVTLLGQNVNSYGKGLDPICSFPELLRQVQDVDGIVRVRFVTSHPRDLSDQLIGAIRDLPKVCESLHLPVQSGSDRVLASMNRRYRGAEYREKVRRLRNAVPDMTITTDIIVGFPGETDDDFADTLQLLGDIEYDNIFAFKYSERPHTKALDLPGHLANEVKDARLDAVFMLQKEITLRKNQRHVGTAQEVLVEGSSKKGDLRCGRTRGNMVVNFPGPADLRGSLVEVRITAAGPNSLSGELCE